MSKINFTSQPLQKFDGLTPAIIKTTTENYRPEGIIIRANISTDMFTAEISYEDIERLENDDEIESISISKSLPSFYMSLK